MKWILIFYLAGYNVSGPDTLYFDDKDSCELAGAAISKAFTEPYSMQRPNKWVCVSSRKLV